MSSLFPKSVTELGGQVDVIHLWLIAVMGFWFVACNGAMIYMLLRYREKGPNQKTSTVKGNHLLETAWTLIPTVICMFIFYYGVQAWSEMRTIPEGGYEVMVKAKKWSWTFTHPDGRIEAQNFYVPAGQPVKMTMKSVDVLHSFFIPEFRVKEDVVPSRYTQLWFQAEVPGTYNLFCTEYCGDDHSVMLGKVHVLDAEDWQKFLADELFPTLTPEEEGARLFTTNGCIGCHSTDGSANKGPTLKGLFGTEETLVGGAKVAVDEVYLEKSIRDPGADIVEGYPTNLMTTFDYLGQEQIDNIIIFIKTLK